MTNLNARLSSSNSTSAFRGSMLPPGAGTPRGVHGMSLDNLRGDLEKGELDDLKSLGYERDEQGRRLVTKVSRTWYGKKRTTVVPVADVEALEGVAEKRPAMVLGADYQRVGVWAEYL